MKWQKIAGDDGAAATYVVVLDPDEEAFGMLSSFVKEQGLTAAQVTAVGAFQSAIVGWYDREKQEYKKIPVGQQCEVLSLIGDVADSDKGPALHLHGVLGIADGTTRGGHLIEGVVWPTLEVVIREAPAELHKTYRPEVGLALIDLDDSH